MTGKRKSQNSTYKIEDLIIKLLLLNRVNNLSLDSERSEEDGATWALCPSHPRLGHASRTL